MKNLKYLLSVLILLIAISYSKAQYGGYGYGGGGGRSVRPMISVNSGNIAGLKSINNVNIVYDYSKVAVGSFRNEVDYLKKKEDDYKKDPEKYNRFKDSWFRSRVERFEPKFEEMFNKMGKKSGISGKNSSSDAPVTLRVETVFVEPGYNIGISRMPAYIDLECTFLDKDGNEIIRYFIKNAVGASAMGFDYDAGSRLVESYAKGCKMLMKDVTKRLSKLK